MTVNLSPAFRLAIYVIGSVGTLITGYLFTKGFIGREEVALWGGFVALGFGLAGINVPEIRNRSNQRGHVDLAVVLLVGILVLLVLVATGRV